MMYPFTRMWQHARKLPVLAAALTLLSVAVSFGQSAPPTMPPNTVYGRLGGGTSGPGQAIPFATLYAQLGIVGGGTFVIAKANAPDGGLPLYAAPAATGTGSCLSLGNACTLATACSFFKQVATFLGDAGPINLANGTYSTVDANGALCSVLGNGGGSSSHLMGITGNCLSPASVILAIPNSDQGFYIKDGGEAAIGGVTFMLGTGSIGINNVGQSSVADYASAGCPVIWSTSGSGSTHITGGSGSFTNLGAGGETITANFNQHWALSGDAQFNAGGVTAISNSTTWSAFFLTATGGGYHLNFVNWSFTGSSFTGARAQLTGPGYMITAAAASCASVFPGTMSGGCSFNLGAQDNASDGIAAVAQGGTGNATATAHSIPISEGTSPQSAVGPCNTNQTLVYTSGSGSDPTCALVGTGAGVPQNNLNTQSGDYSIQTTDCGNTINETGAQKTITLPSVSGFATNCVLAVYNASSTRGQILSGFPGALAAAPANILWPLDTVTVQIVNGAWSLQSYPARHKITAAITVYVDGTNGNDAHDCLAATTGACKTRQGAFNYINTWDGNEQAILVSVAAGTYTANLTQNGPFHGNPAVTLQGDLSTPSNVLISTTSADGLDLNNGAILAMGGFKFVTTTGGNGILVSNASFLNITGAMEYGAAANFQIGAASGSTITITADYTISGGAVVHWSAIQGSQILVSGSHTITLSGTPAYSNAFVTPLTGGLVGAASTTFSGSATGKSFSVNKNGFLNNGATLPGSLSTSLVATHGYVALPGTPSISSCGTSPGTANGTDFSGNVTEGTTATGCTITFATGSVFTSCTASLSSGDAVGISTLGATLVVVHSILSGDKLYWTCSN